MHFLNLDGMIDDLKANRISEGQSFRYLVGYFVVVGFPSQIFNSGEPAQKTPEALPLLIGYAIGIGLLYWFLSSVYRANRGDRGKQFFLRYFLLSWVVGFRSSIVTIPLIAIVSFLVKLEAVKVSTGVSMFFLALLILSVLGGLIYYVSKMHEAFRALASHDQLTSSDDQLTSSEPAVVP